MHIRANSRELILCKLAIVTSDHIDYATLQYRSQVCPLSQTSYNIMHDRHRNIKAYMHAHNAGAFNKQRRPATRIRSCDHVNGRPVGTRTPLWWPPSSLTNNMPTHASRYCHRQRHNFVGGLLTRVWSSGTHVSVTTGQVYGLRMYKYS